MLVFPLGEPPARPPGNPAAAPPVGAVVVLTYDVAGSKQDEIKDDFTRSAARRKGNREPYLLSCST